jgi:Flp pilus assembly pilin Flp
MLVSLSEGSMKGLMGRFVREDEGQDLIEYALLGAFVSIAAVVGANFLGTKLKGWYTGIGATVGTMSTAP